jgi:hypothetical protein
MTSDAELAMTDSSYDKLVEDVARGINDARMPPIPFDQESTVSQVYVRRLSRAAMAIIFDALQTPDEAMLDAALVPTASRLDVKGSGVTIAREKMRRRILAYLAASPLSPSHKVGGLADGFHAISSKANRRTTILRGRRIS